MMEPTHIINPLGYGIEVMSSRKGFYVQIETPFYELESYSGQCAETEDEAIRLWNARFSKAPLAVEPVKSKGGVL